MQNLELNLSKDCYFRKNNVIWLNGEVGNRFSPDEFNSLVSQFAGRTRHLFDTLGVGGRMFVLECTSDTDILILNWIAVHVLFME